MILLNTNRILRRAGVPAAFSFLLPALASLQVFVVSLRSQAAAGPVRVNALV